MDNEIWKDVLGFEGKYQVSNLGRVKSLDRYVRLVAQGVETKRLAKGKMLRPGSLKSGHVSVAIGRNNSRLVHQLVLETFIGPCPEGFEVLHLNHKPNDNRLCNLCYGTRSENLKMDYKAGRRKVHPNFNRWGHIYA